MASPRHHGDGEPVLVTRSLTKIFGGLSAVSDFDLAVHKGEILSLIGPNGAGKTTVFNVVTGIYRPEHGSVLFRGSDITGMKPHRIVRMGIARTFQNIRLFPDMTCLENVMAGRHARTEAGFWASLFRTPGMRREEENIRRAALERIEQVGLGGFANELARNIAYGSQRMLEIARALATEPDLLVLDEPSSGLNPRETEDLMAFLRNLIRHENLTILLIEHDMNVVMGISDWVVVMDDGVKIAEGVPEDVYHNPLVIEAYLGTGEEAA
ncbi:MAG TPA: ABC transporter ATP-binding protein [Deltaproteobacteria bacterium]|nr:ABC transporter ATP-binding protein [Deltaproteobacteria bacterium]